MERSVCRSASRDKSSLRRFPRLRRNRLTTLPGPNPCCTDGRPRQRSNNLQNDASTASSGHAANRSSNGRAIMRSWLRRTYSVVWVLTSACVTSRSGTPLRISVSAIEMISSVAYSSTTGWSVKVASCSPCSNSDRRSSLCSASRIW